MDLINESTMVLQREPASWRDLVQESADLLVRAGVVTSAYVEGIFESFEANGAYMMVAPYVLLSHTRPEKGATGTGLSLITVTEDVLLFDESDKPVRLFFTLAATDADAHLELLANLAEVLIDDDLFAELTTTSDPQRVQQILRGS